MANRFTARMRKVLEARGESLERLSEAEADQAKRDTEIQADIRRVEEETALLIAEMDAKDPCWRCRHSFSGGFQPWCMVDRQPRPAGGCHRSRCGHAG